MTARSERGRGAASRVAAIVESVERAATEIIDEAEDEARRYVESSRRRAEEEAADRLGNATELADGLVERAERLRRELDGLVEALGAARVRLEAALDADVSPPVSEAPPVPDEAPAAQTSRSGPDLKPVPEPGPREGVEAPGDAEDAGREEERSAISGAGARLLATQMAMSGSVRAEVAARLEKELPVEEANRIVETVFGPED